MWTKVSRGTMPTDMEVVIVTAENGKDRYVILEARYNQRINSWEFLCEEKYNYWENIQDKVTHWMPIPEPAKD